MSLLLYEALEKDPSEALPLVRDLLAQGAEVNEKNSLSTFLNPLAVAAQRQTPDVIELLLDHGADINARNCYWHTPLSPAIECVKVDNCKTLLQHRANPSLRSIQGTLALEHAVKKQSVDIVKLLLDHGVDIHSMNNIGGTMLLTAIMIDYAYEKMIDGVKMTRVIESFSKDKLDIMRLLIDNGINVNARGIDDTISLHCAAIVGDVEPVKILLAAGADPNLTDLNGCKPLWKAVRHNHTKIVRLLLPITTNINGQTYNGQTCLSTAARWGKKESVELLLEAGAEIWPGVPGPGGLPPEQRLPWYACDALFYALDGEESNDDTTRLILAAGAARPAAEPEFKKWLQVWDRGQPKELLELGAWAATRNIKTMKRKNNEMRHTLSTAIDNAIIDRRRELCRDWDVPLTHAEDEFREKPELQWKKLGRVKQESSRKRMARKAR